MTKCKDLLGRVCDVSHLVQNSNSNRRLKHRSQKLTILAQLAGKRVHLTYEQYRAAQALLDWLH